MARSRKSKRVLVTPRKKKQATTKSEVSLLGSMLRKLGTAAGGAVGSMVGAPVSGAAAGHGLGAAISRWLGAGDYEVSTNSLVQRVRSSNGIPMMHNTGQTVVVRHKEYLGEVRSSTGFIVRRSFPLNPGSSDTFPWLSRIARRFQEYAFKGIVFHFVPTSGSISSTQALGSVMMQTTYRTTDNAPASKIEMLNEYWASEAVPNEAFVHPIECDPKENPFNVHYVRSGDVSATDNLLAYDLGRMHLATSGQAVADVVLGDLWVTYEVELKKPVLLSSATSGGELYEYSFTPGTSASLFATVVSFGGTLPLITSRTTNVVTIPPGETGDFYFSVLIGPITTSAAFTWTGNPTLTNCTTTYYYSGLVDAVGTVVSATAGLVFARYQVAIRKTDPAVNATVTIPTPIVTGTFSNSWLTVTKVDPTF